jgi:HTH-type transcriptional regulator/antitoxin HipB
VRSPKALGDALSRLRYERGLTQAELADSLGIDRRYIYELESGKETRYALRLFEVLRDLGAHIDIVPEDHTVRPGFQLVPQTRPDDGA